MPNYCHIGATDISTEVLDPIEWEGELVGNDPVDFADIIIHTLKQSSFETKTPILFVSQPKSPDLISRNGYSYSDTAENFIVQGEIWKILTPESNTCRLVALESITWSDVGTSPWVTFFLLLGSWGLLWSFQISFCSPIRRLTIQCPTWPEENKTCLGSLSCTPRSMSLYCTLTNQLIIDSLPYSLTKDRCIHSSLYPTSVVWKVKQCTREWFESRTSWVEACRRQSRSLEWCRA